LNKLFIALFAVILGLSIIFFVFTTLFICIGIKWTRFVSHVAWNLITIAVLMLAGVFGILGTAMVYVAPVFEVIFSTDGLKVLFSGNQDMINIMDTCMNKGGDLKPVIGPQNDMADTLDVFVQNSYKINQLNSNFNNIQGSPLAIYNRDRYVSLETDYLADISISPDSASAVNTELISYTNYYAPSSKQSSCSSNTYDIWVTNSNSCHADYKYTEAADAKTNIGSNTCLNVRLWDATKVKTRYSDRPSCSSLSVADSASSYVTSLNNYASSAAEILKAMEKDMDM
jgi:hypothetical protein